MEAASPTLPPLRCTPTTCTIAQVLPSTALPLTHDDTALAWRACTSLAQLCHLQLHYYHSQLPFTPTYNGALHSESHTILASLAAIASSGLFVPTFSQPAVGDDEHNGYYGRLGCPQRAAVSGWTSELGVKRIQAQWKRARLEAEAGQRTANSLNLHICITPPANPTHNPSSTSTQPTPSCLHPFSHSTSTACTAPITRTAVQPSSRPSARQRLGLAPVRQLPAWVGERLDGEGVGGEVGVGLEGGEQWVVLSCGGGGVRWGKEGEDWRRWLGGDGRRWVELDGWMVWIVDEQWGRKERLWQFLEQALTAEL